MKFKTIYTTFILLFLVYFFSSLSGGRTGTYSGAPGDSGTCSPCHSGGVFTGGNIALTGAPTTYSPGAIYNLTLTTSGTAGSPAAGGFQIVATNGDGSTNAQIGTFSTPAGTKLVGDGRLVQNTPKAFSGGSVSWNFNWTAPSSGPPASIRFYFSGCAVDLTGNTANDNGYSGSSIAIPLPVELSQFNVQPMDGMKVKLDWQTRSETNSDYFIVQRNTQDNQFGFEDIGKITAAGDASWAIDYSFVDENPIVGQPSYYRLKQVDNNESYEYSLVKSVNVKDENRIFNMYPNPVKRSETLTVEFSNNIEQTGMFQILDTQGKIVYQSEKELQSGTNILTIELPHLQIGQYFLLIKNNNVTLNVNKLMIIE